MSNDPKYYDVWKTTEGMIPAPCRMSGMVHYSAPEGGGWVSSVQVVGWGPDATPVISLSDGSLGAMTKNMKMTDIGPV